MNDAKSGTFSGRGFTSVASAVCFVALAVTGGVLFVTPPGRVAHWTGWRLLGLTKDQWGALHIWFALLFLIASGFHIWLNWRPLLSYFKSRLTRRFALRREWTLALAMCGVAPAVLVLGSSE
jgi:succinate dehydrogenase hydrophobic anchor subunit